MSVVVVQEAVVPAGTARSSVLTLISSAVGAGVLSFPFALRCTGWAAGLACIAGIAGVEAFTLYVLTKVAEATGTSSYSALVHRMLGRGGSLVMSGVIFFYCFGSCIAYLIIIGDSFRPILLELFGHAWWTSRVAVIAGVGGGVVLPVCFRTRLGALRAVSSLCFYGLVGVTAIVVWRADEILSSPDYSWEPVQAFNAHPSFLTALPIIVFGFHCHTNVISVWEELGPRPSFFRPASPLSPAEQEEAAAAAAEHEAQGGPEAPEPTQQQGQQRQAGRWGIPAQQQPNGRRPKSEKLAGMAAIVAAAVGITALFYSSVGLAGYLAFPSNTQSNITKNFPEDDPLVQVARAMVGLIQLAAYPVNHFPARGAVRDLAQHATGHAPAGPGFVAAETLAFFAATLALALAVDDLGSIFKLVGGTCGSILILTMPGALLMRYATSKQAAAAAAAAGAGLHVPLLAEAGAAAGAPPLPRQAAYSAWRSKYFWTGLVLVLASVALGALTVVTTLHPLPPP